MSNLIGSEEIKIRGLSKTEKTFLQSLAYSDNGKSLNQYLLDLIKFKVSENELQNYQPFFEEMLAYQKQQLDRLEQLHFSKKEMLENLQRIEVSFNKLIDREVANGEA